METKVMSQDVFLHLTDIENLLGEMSKQADWAKSEMVKQISEAILSLERFTITVECKA